jgi:hopanoid biosynthesis associated RND transporter like protein HpnN
VSKRFEGLLRAGAAGLVGASIARPWLVVAICALLTACSVYLAVTLLGVETDKDQILSPDQYVQQANDALAEAFPVAQNNLVVMVEADDPADARAAAKELSGRLADQPDRYLGVFLPGDAPYYEQFGLYHLDRDELDEVAARIDQAGPLLATLMERPELPVLVGGLTHVVGRVDGLSSLGQDGPRILDEIALAVERFNEGGRAPIAWGELLFNDLGGDAMNPQLLFVRPAGDLTQLSPVMEAITAIRAMQRDLTPRPGLRVRITGERAVHTEEMSLVIGEAIVAGCVSLLLVTLILFVCFRSIRLVIATVTTLLVGLSWTAGLAALAVGQLNALTSAFAVVYIGLAVDFSIHFGLAYLEQRRTGKDLQPALRATGETAGNALVLCALTTMIGFYAFIPTAYTGVSDMGIISGTGVLFGLLANLTLYPALIRLGLGESRRTASWPLARLEIRLPSFPLRYPRAVCVAAAALTIASCSALPWVRFDVNPLNVRDPRVESVQALKELLADSEHSAWTMEILTQDLAEARALELQLEALEGVHHVNSPESFLPEDQTGRLAVFEQMRSDLEASVELREDETGEDLDPLTAIEYAIEGYGVALDLDEQLRDPLGDEDASVEGAERLNAALLVLHGQLRDEANPPDVGALEEDLFGELPPLLDDIIDRLPARRVSIEDLPDELLGRYLAADGRARVEVFSTAGFTAPGELERFNDLVHSVRPDAGGPVAGTVALAREVVASLRQALTTAVVVIAILLMLLLRSLKYTTITLTPLLIGSVATAAASVVANIPFNFANIIVLPLILGIGVDSGIHLVHRHRTGLLGAGGLLRTSTANAVLFSALTTGASFATLALSNHLGIASLAQMLTVGIALMLAANVIALPAILTLVGDGAARPQGAADPITRV